ncbi:activator-dependent family glycosyltransferase [Amycolatopsis suaedae]|uniref:Activator-dependent family glycosyltransferase n=1 Tax=Amycolatopsis suaedae TaxID=2510978 RepID=A0A4Q7J5W5_9PSEU|nr:activator-dependent family glycosyltransferase [Amycolatopsis suaedae]RZQ62519.1 activator-dependent family glycosyltransferase [Amycolatopsis suaedae]
MRVLFTTFAARSHLNLSVPLAWAMRAAGHEVRVASQPDLVGAIQDAGLAAVPVGTVLDMPEQARKVGEYGDFPGDRSLFNLAETDPARLSWSYVRGALTLYSTAISGVLADDEMLAGLVGFARDWQPDLVIWDAFTYAGGLAAAACGAAHARVVFGPDHFGRMRLLFHRLSAEQPEELRDDPMAQWLAGRLAPYGGEFSEDLVTGHATIDPMPPSIQVPGGPPHLSMRFVPYSGRTSFPEWVHEPAPRPRVCLTLGLSARDYGLPTPPVSDLLAALAELDVEVIATLDLRQLEEIGTVPDNVRVFDFVPLDALLPTCAAIVHHFGAGTVATALSHGVPQLYVSDGINQWGEEGVARQVIDQGAALGVSAAELTPEVLAGKLRRLLTEPSFADRAQRLREEARAVPAPADLVPVLERLAREHARELLPLGRA